MDNNSIFDRTHEVQKAKEESERSDLKQHADKMLRDFEKFNDFSSNRAIWELVQNACDLTTDCRAIIDYRDEKFSFIHNGRPFNSNSLISLIKQVSGDKDENSEIPPVGKYGTGFLTTHSLGRKFIINSTLQSSSGHFIEVKDFLIDRSPRKWEELSDQIRIQKDKVFDIIDKTGKIVDNPEQITAFTYLPETDQEKKYVAESFRDLEEYIPIVLTINSRLKYVKIISPVGLETEFTLSSKKEIPNEVGIKLYKTSIKKDKEDRVIYSVVDPINEIEIILPVNKDLFLFEFPKRIAKLFLYYPLIGTEDFGINFIINCNHFLPTEPRDGIHINSNKDQVKDQEEANKELIEKASTLLFQFLNSNILPVKNPLLYANINFKRNSDNLLLNQYFISLQEKWVENFKNLEIVETKMGYKKVTDVTFLNPVLLENDDYFDSIYTLFDKFYIDVPSQQTIKYWSYFVSKWEYAEANFISNEDLAKKIQECSLADFDKDLLKKYYTYLLEKKHSNLFTDFKLLPNIEENFQYLNVLKMPQGLDNTLIKIGKGVISDSVAQLVNKDFSFDFKFDPYTRKDFSNSVNTKLNAEFTDSHICLPEVFDQNDYITLGKSNFTKLDPVLFLEVLDFCKLHNNANSQSKPSKLMGLISEYYNINKELIQVDPVGNKEDDLDVRQAQKRLVKVFFNTLLMHTEQWVERNIGLLYDIAIYNEDRYKDVYLGSKIYPNQVHKLTYLSDLKKGIALDNKISDLYNRTSNKIIEASIAPVNFNELLIDNEEVTNKSLATAIEEVFFETDIHDINEHPFKEDILNIISKLNTSFYKELFPRLDGRKANLMLEIVTNENTKDDIFSIVTLKEEQLKKLGKIVQLPNFDEILSQAENAVRLEKEKKSDFAHKHKIGTYIENKIREKLNEAIASKILVDKDRSLDAEDVQAGQDIIIYYEEIPLYYIEVKSRWDSRNSVSMSKLQLEKASENSEKYSLISVDVTKYQGNSNRYELPLEEIIPLIKVVNNIGQNIQPLITNNLAAERDQSSTVKLVDYRGVINQDFINTGSYFDSFLNGLIDYINSSLAFNND
ncbi:sacsin N-terminal ATP-binding-like domain-containing protein [Sediminibacterium soli]|uniref:sacsin N-terminal ATP-binding-like domain-containing protein n=1 Tax=Sediminibacterium soli TaxID=2698829 RepID=UPI00137B5627|nr:DUF3883 domain-containing protein [Sediminibacterium soli]NCI46724.1 DUF3883 domain-containing protein [Sediminibacterium soli]